MPKQSLYKLLQMRLNFVIQLLVFNYLSANGCRRGRWEFARHQTPTWFCHSL